MGFERFIEDDRDSGKDSSPSGFILYDLEEDIESDSSPKKRISFRERNGIPSGIPRYMISLNFRNRYPHNPKRLRKSNRYWNKKSEISYIIKNLQMKMNHLGDSLKMMEFFSGSLERMKFRFEGKINILKK